MRALLKHFLNEECYKHIRKQGDYLYELHEDIKRKALRSGSSVEKKILRPSYWSLDPRFHPFKTRVPRKLDLYSYTLAQKIKQRHYIPARALKHYIRKEDGSQRELNVFQLPDAALSCLIYKSLLHKNINRLSGYAYAYREDRGAHDAIDHIFTEWRNLDRIYVAEYDFSKFFDNIRHEYLYKILERHGFIYAPEERLVLEAFLNSESAKQDDYKAANAEKRTKGIPQGTSISLFLANLACWELDRALERLGVGFSRYADDTLVWSESYAKVVQAYDAIRHYSEMMAVPVNLEKSEGISLITRRPPGEISSKESIDYLGYKLSLSSISIKKLQVDKIKRRLGYIVYQNLLQQPKRGNYNMARLSTLDWDYVVALSQVRRYLYGGLSDEKLRKYIRGQVPRLNFRGLMSYYPLVNDREQLSDLDGWLIHVMRESLRLREKMWRANHGIALPGPTPGWIEKATELRSWKDGSGQEYDLRIPSFSLITKAMQIAIKKSGIGTVAHPGSEYY